jgi:dihydropteroate synthase
MGILNVTPDSFSDGGKFDTVEKAVIQAEKMMEDGADIIDIGGESTRPGAQSVDAEEEISRTVPVITEILKKYPKTIISIDTSKSEVAMTAVKAGAKIVNDISGLNFDEKMAKTCAELNVPVIIMHIKGEPRTMQKDPKYENLLEEVTEYFENAVEKAVKAGIKREKLIIDPGIGFGKTLEHNLSLIKHLEVFHIFSLPILVGLSRKSMIGAVTGRKEPQKREAGTTAFHMKVLEKDVAILRVHDVASARDTLAVNLALKESKCF